MLALAGFDIAVKPGELVVVLGNGSGKTTPMRCVTRTHAATDRRQRAGQRHRPRVTHRRETAPRAARAGADLPARQPSEARSVLANVALVGDRA
jgi:ABC-type phosphate/phosphonate transport system ATPase subunit